MTLEELRSVAEIVEKLTNRYRDQEAAHKAALEEMRTSFVARTGADEKLLEGRRMEIIRLNGANDRLNDLLRAERLAHRDEVAALQERLRGLNAVENPKHPVKVGEWVRRSNRPGDQSPVGIVKQVTSIRHYGYSYGFADRDCWCSDNCEPCDPPATHDTPEGRSVAESVIRESRSAEIEMCVGDEVEVIGRSAPAPGSGMFTGTIAPVGTRGTATMIHRTAGFVELDNGTRASLKDVRKVTT